MKRGIKFSVKILQITGSLEPLFQISFSKRNKIFHIQERERGDDTSINLGV
ncbi:MAG: hypothetical protein M3Y25_01700 [Thermoproteota archaeon]|nr:hypothetical protein [Thermoproteota archaeon]